MVAVLLPALFRGVLAAVRDVRDVPDIARQRMLPLPQRRGTPVTGPEISYVSYLQRRIEDQLQGRWTTPHCGPPIADYPTLFDRIWPYTRPNYELKARLEAQLRDIEADLGLDHPLDKLKISLDELEI
jgi:hypothetical protein